MPWKFDRETGEMIESAEFDRRKLSRRATSNLAFPMVVSDQIEIKSMVDGKTYTSKSALRQSYRAKGYLEVGNESFKDPLKFKPDRKSIRNSVGKALNRVGISVS
jgi:hypothetical protein